tara:strand:- start:5212 stop:5958 length:747 start_codon:yes stop_codon:yes gene_type:complete
MKIIKNILFFIFIFFPVNSLIIRKPLKAFHGGLELGVTTLTTGVIMDNTIAKNSLVKLKENSNELYKNGMRKVLNNLLILGPIYYFGVDNFIISDHMSNINLIETFDIVLIHSFGYYTAHRLMHRSDLFRKYHNFHHKFNETLTPSIGNAVSASEFTFAYMTPFMIGACIVDPNINSFNLGIMIVAFMNLVIHTQELNNINYNNLFVSPKTHLYHHQRKNKRSTYSAPTFNLEFIYSELKNIFNTLSK